MSLFVPPTTLQLSPAEYEEVTRHIEGDGGHQRLLKAIVPRIQEHGTLTLEDDELLKAARYAYDYGGGGYQGRFKALLAAARRAGWKRA